MKFRTALFVSRFLLSAFLITIRRIIIMLKKVAKEDRRNLLTEMDVEFLRSIGVKTGSETVKMIDKRAGNEIKLLA